MFLLLLLALIVLGVLMLIVPKHINVTNSKYRKNYWRVVDFFEGLGSIISVFVGVILVGSLLVWLGSYAESQNTITKYHATKATVKELREKGEFIISSDIIEINKKIAVEQYWNDSIWFGYQVPNEVSELEPLN